MLKGYMGKVLWVDLSSRKFEVKPLDEKDCRCFLGGYGLGANILFNTMKKGIDPLGENNILGFLAGTLTGTPALGGSRYAVVGKSPLTDTWGDSNSGGFFGPHLRFSGFDGIILIGKSEKPVYLYINNGKVEIRDGTHLWGKDTCITEDILRHELEQDIKIACIGPAGEKLALIAAVINDKGRAAGRSGLGAVMGSKNLKAIAVRGTRSVPVFDEIALSELRKKTTKQLSALVDTMRRFGTCAMLVHAVQSDDSPVKNWGGVGIKDFPNVELIGANRIIERQIRQYACYKCPLGCGGVMEGSSGEYQYETGVHKPEYETLSMLGSNCLNENLESIIKLNDMCNRLGLDTISTGAALAFAIECYENGLISNIDTGGIKMTWGNHKSLVAMTEMMGSKMGFGGILADGVKSAAEKIGGDCQKFAVHLQGQEYPGHDPKGRLKWAIAYRMDATPARHTQGGGVTPPGLPLPEINPETLEGGGLAQKILTDFNHVINSSGLCQIVYGTYPSVQTVVEFMNAVTGWNVTLEELLLTGERIANLRHAFNWREGLNPLEYQVPDRIAGKPPKKEGPMAGAVLREDFIDREYCNAMDWDTKTAKPGRKKLSELGLAEVSRTLWH